MIGRAGFIPAAFCSISALTSCQKPELSSRERFDPTRITDATPLRELLKGLGHDVPDRSPGNSAAAASGLELLTTGLASDPAMSASGKKLSSYFYCLDCHETRPETALPGTLGDPGAQLAFLIANDLPLLPGTSFAGLVNRERYFNGDYAEHFAVPAAVLESLEEAIQFCSVEVAGGRRLDEAELGAVLDYLWTLEWKVGDLGFSGADLAELKRRSLNPDEHGIIISELRERYAVAAPATLGPGPADLAVGYPTESEPDASTGAQIWSRACLHCHDADGASEHFFGDKDSTWKELAAKFEAPAGATIYDYIRRGSWTKESRGSAMPAFTLEKLSDAQIEDLRAYLRSKADAE